jgi:hypothetical protein
VSEREVMAGILALEGVTVRWWWTRSKMLRALGMVYVRNLLRGEATRRGLRIVSK